MLTLSEAVREGKLAQFVAEHPEMQGDMEAFNRTVEAMTGKSQSDRQTSDGDGGDD